MSDETIFTRISIVIALSVFIPGFLFGFSNSKGNRLLRLTMAILVITAFSYGTYQAWQVPGAYPSLSIAGGCILLLASTLFLAARWSHVVSPQKAFTDEAPPVLVIHGPYRIIRHPIYAAYILGLFGTLLLATDWFMLSVAVPLMGLYVWAGLQEEKSIANSELADAYQAYARQTGFLLPKFSCFLLCVTHLNALPNG